MSYRLFIDPASISTGWALFKDREFVQSGTVKVSPLLDVYMRIDMICDHYRELDIPAIEEVHIEQLVRMTHIFTHYSVGAIGATLVSTKVRVAADVPIKSWQKHVEWKAKKGQPFTVGGKLQPYVSTVHSQDELAAIGMGIYWTETKLPKEDV